MFDNGREDTTMKHVVLIALGFVLSFAVSVVCNPFADGLLTSGSFFFNISQRLSGIGISSLFAFFIAPCFFFLYGQVTKHDYRTVSKSKKLRITLFAGNIFGSIYVAFYAWG